MATKLKKGIEVVVTAGDHKGSKGKILQILRSKERVLIEGVNLVKKHERKTQDNPQGAIVEREASIHISNIKKA
jgi:large subunit ribosomal protein L24